MCSPWLWWSGQKWSTRCTPTGSRASRCRKKWKRPWRTATRSPRARPLEPCRRSRVRVGCAMGRAGWRRGPGDAFAAMFLPPLRRSVPASGNTARGVSWWRDFRPGGMTLQVMVWSGNRTRDTRFTRPMLYPTELSKQLTYGTRTRNPWAIRPLLSQLSQRHREAPPCRLGHTRAAAPCAPDGIDAVPQEPVGGCFEWPPLAKRPCSCDVAVAKAVTSKANAQKKTPPDVCPRAFAVPRRSGDRSPRGEDQSKVVSPASRSTPLPRAYACTTREGRG